MPAAMMETGLVRIPEDIYDATYLGAEVVEITDKQTKKAKDLFEHKFEVVVGHKDLGGKPVVLKQLSDLQMTLGNKTGKIAKAVSARDVPVGEQFEFNDYKGHKLRIVVKDKQVANGVKSEIKEFVAEKK